MSKIKFNLLNINHLIAVGFGSGLAPKAPGTFGSLAAVIFAYLYFYLIGNNIVFGILTIALFFIGIHVCKRVTEDIKVHDHGSIVIDEIVAEFLIITCMPGKAIIWFILSFIIFRFFDVLKPYPISLADKKISNAFGIMFDDILAAIYSLITMYVIFLICN
ncbi:MAG: phosphatidylglycerophosphatase A [Psittacicella sp.]